MWKTLQDKGKNHGHRPATTFYYFVECLHNAVSSGGLQNLSAMGLRFARRLGSLKNLDHNSTKDTWQPYAISLRKPGCQFLNTLYSAVVVDSFVGQYCVNNNNNKKKKKKKKKDVAALSG